MSCYGVYVFVSHLLVVSGCMLAVCSSYVAHCHTFFYMLVSEVKWVAHGVISCCKVGQESTRDLTHVFVDIVRYLYVE